MVNEKIETFVAVWVRNMSLLKSSIGWLYFIPVFHRDSICHEKSNICKDKINLEMLRVVYKPQIRKQLRDQQNTVIIKTYIIQTKLLHVLLAYRCIHIINRVFDTLK